MENVKNSAASVADQLLIDSLTPELRAAIERVYGTPDDGIALYTEADLRAAYTAGWDECAEQIEAPWMGNRDDWYIQDLKRKGK